MNRIKTIDDLLKYAEATNIPKEEFNKGMKVETEHSDTIKKVKDDPDISMEDALESIIEDHETEFKKPEYYKYLDKMEKTMEKEVGKKESFIGIKDLDDLIDRHKQAIDLVDMGTGAAGGFLKACPQGAAIGALKGIQIKDVLNSIENPSENAVFGSVQQLVRLIPQNMRSTAINFIREKMQEYGLSEEDTIDDIAMDVVHYITGASEGA